MAGWSMVIKQGSIKGYLTQLAADLVCQLFATPVPSPQHDNQNNAKHKYRRNTKDYRRTQAQWVHGFVPFRCKK